MINPAGWILRPSRRRTRFVGAACAAVLITGIGVQASDAALPKAVAAVVAPSGLTAHWAFDEGSGSTAADSSGNGYTASLGSGVGWAAGHVGSHAISVDGTAQGVATVGHPVVDTSKSFTVSAWVRLNSTSGYQTIVGIDGSTIGGFFLQLSAATGAFAMTRRASDDPGATEVRADSGVKPAVGTWYHIVGEDDVADGQLKVFVDGQEGTDAAFTSAWQATGDTSIGRGDYNGPVDFTNGSIDDVQMFQSALTADQVAALDDAAHWTFDEGTGTTAADSSGNGHDLTLDSGASWTDGRVGPHALAVNGTSTGDAFDNQPVVDTAQSFSVAGWVRFTQTGGFQDIATIDGSNVSGFFLQLRNDGTFAFTRLASDSTSAATTIASSSTKPVAGRWYHLVGVQDVAAGTLQLYVNGVLEGTASYSTPWHATGRTAIGRGLYYGAPTDFLSGSIDDVHFRNHAVTAGEVQNMVGSLGGLADVNAAAPLHALPSTFFGLMTEDINHSVSGGLYPELINNRSMMAADTPVDWSPVGNATISLDASTPLNSALTRSLKVDLANVAGGASGVANDGYWGIPVVPGREYDLNLFAKASAHFKGSLTAAIVSSDGSTTYASAKVGGVGTAWAQLHAKLRADAGAPVTADAKFVITAAAANSGGTLWLDNVSLFPPTYDNVPNGLRPDLMDKFAALKPAFIREPGGNYLEGNTLATMFNWKDTIGPTWTRPGHMDDAWGYWSTDGMGLLEYLEWCEQVGAKPLLAVFAGYTLNHTVVPQDQLAPYVQDALDEIEYATGSVDTTWGHQRAVDGHPKPFVVDYVEVGNEDFFDNTGSYNSYRFPMFYDAIKKAYPKMSIVATTPVTSRTPDVVDDHFYESASWMESHADYYDNASRTGPKIMVGEWATREGSPTPDMNAALGDAVWLSGLERNSDLVTQEAYAPSLVNVNNVAWSTDLIGFNALTSYGSPSYWVQQMLANNHGDQVLDASYAGVGGVEVTATKNSTTGTVYVTIVNPGSAAQKLTVNVAGEDVAAVGTEEVLSATSPTATNTIDNPGNISPKTTPISGVSASFSHTAPAYSVTVLTLQKAAQ